MLPQGEFENKAGIIYGSLNPGMTLRCGAGGFTVPVCRLPQLQLPARGSARLPRVLWNNGSAKERHRLQSLVKEHVTFI